MTRGEAEAVGVRVGERLTPAGRGTERARDQEMERRKEKHRDTQQRKGGTHTQGGIRREGENRVRRGGETGRKDMKRQSRGQIQSEKLDGKSNK